MQHKHGFQYSTKFNYFNYMHENMESCFSRLRKFVVHVGYIDIFDQPSFSNIETVDTLEQVLHAVQ